MTPSSCEVQCCSREQKRGIDWKYGAHVAKVLWREVESWESEMEGTKPLLEPRLDHPDELGMALLHDHQVGLCSIFLSINPRMTRDGQSY